MSNKTAFGGNLTNGEHSAFLGSLSDVPKGAGEFLWAMNDERECDG